MKRINCACLVLAGLLLSACQGIAVNRPAPITITVGGSTAMRPVMQELSASFSARHPGVLFDLSGGGSTLGEERTLARRLTLGLSTLNPPVDPDTQAPLDDGLARIPIGIDAIAIVVHPTSDLSALSLVQLRDLYAGEVLDWLQLGADEGEVLLVSREEGSGTRANFESIVMGESPVSLTAIVMPTSADVVDYVASMPQTIGYVSRSLVTASQGGDESEAGETRLRVLPVEGAMPDNQGVTEHQYPLVQPLFIVSRGEPTGRARQFVDFVLSPAGQEIVAKYHVPIR